MIQPTAQKLEEELHRVRDSSANTTNALIQERRDAMFASMDANPAIRGWREINDSEIFLAWLDKVDILSGVSRRILLADAFRKLDTTRVSAIFEKFIQEDAAQRAASAPPLDPETLLAPTSRGGQPPVAPGDAKGRRILSESEIRDFYSRVRRRQVSREEYSAFSAEIAAATAEGRVRPDRPDHHQNAR